ncbi:MAG TPA: hypothetical protein VGM70_09480 [Pseudolysinimonas sp.]
MAAAAAASIVALSLGYLDRRNARHIAARDRAEALRDSQLLFEQEQLVRLLENLRQGGSTDPLIRSRLGGEAAAVIGFMGKDRLPMNWANRVLPSDAATLEDVMNDASRLDWIRQSAEVQVALERVTAQIRTRLNPSGD